MHVKTKLSSASAVAKVFPELTDEDRLFISFYEQCVNGLLAGNTYYSEDSICWQEMLEQEELLQRAEQMAEMMIEAVKDRMEVQRFERKVK